MGSLDLNLNLEHHLLGPTKMSKKHNERQEGNQIEDKRQKREKLELSSEHLKICIHHYIRTEALDSAALY